MSIERFGDKVSFIWSVADLLRGPYKPAQYGDVMLPLTRQSCLSYSSAPGPVNASKPKDCVSCNA